MTGHVLLPGRQTYTGRTIGHTLDPGRPGHTRCGQDATGAIPFDGPWYGCTACLPKRPAAGRAATESDDDEALW